MNSNSEDNDSDSEGPHSEPSEILAQSDDDKKAVDQYEHVQNPAKKFKLSYFQQAKKVNSFEAAIDEQTALERDAKCQRGFNYNYQVMSPRPKHKACKPTP